MVVNISQVEKYHCKPVASLSEAVSRRCPHIPVMWLFEWSGHGGIVEAKEANGALP